MARTRLERLQAKIQVNVSTGCWEWMGTRNSNGYGMFHWGKKDATRDIPMVAHRAAWKLLKGEIPADRMVRHLCNNAICCNPDHLALGTHAENMADRDAAGRTVAGANHYYFKRTGKLIEAFKKLRAEGVRVDRICEILDCGRNTYYRAVRRDSELAEINRKGRSTMASQALANRILAGEDGLIRCGEANNKAKLTADKVRQIRARRVRGENLRTLAAEFGITETAICNVCLGKTWKHVS